MKWEETKELKDLIEKALNDLVQAAIVLEKPTYPQTPLPRPRRFTLVGGYTWEWNDSYIRGDRTIWLATSADALAQICGYQPRKVLRLLRRIQAATAWCEARREGRERQAQEILRQQKKALEALEAESVLGKLAQ
jgi:hypothetical protein